MTTKMRYNEQQVLGIMQDYHWAMNRILDMRESLNEIFARTTKYGVEATMPKGQGHVNDPVYQEILRRERAKKSLEPLFRKVTLIQTFMDTSIYDSMDWKNKLILNLTLEGATVRAIGGELKMATTTVYSRQKAIARIIAAYSNEQDVQTA